MKIILYIVSIFFILAGLGGLYDTFTKSDSQNINKIGEEFPLFCFFSFLGGLIAIIIKNWTPILTTIILIWIIRAYYNYKRQNNTPINKK